MPKRILQGVVVSDKQEKTLVVKVERRFTHPLLKKTVRRTKNYHAHVENKTQKVGDTVSIQEYAPDLEAEALDRHRRGGADGMTGALSVRLEFIRGRELPSGVVRPARRRKPI